MLKPCPFCGGAPQIFTAFGTKVECTKCGVKIYDFSKETAISRWNNQINAAKIMTGIINESLYINGCKVEWPDHSHNRTVTQHGEDVYVNGFKWTVKGWKRTLPAVLYHLFNWL